MNDLRTITPKRDIARELARKYSTMTHDELDILEGILEPVKYGKGEMIPDDRPQRPCRVGDRAAAAAVGRALGLPRIQREHHRSGWLRADVPVHGHDLPHR